MKLNVLISVSILAAWSAAYAAAPSPSPSPLGGKNVRGKVEEPRHAKPVGVQAADPTRNGQVNTSGALSPLNENSMGLGVQFDLTKPKKAAPKKRADKDAEEAE